MTLENIIFHESVKAGVQSYIKRENAYFSGNKRVFASSPFVQREGRVKGLRDAGVECERLWRTSSVDAHIFLSLGAPRLKLPGGSRAQSIKMQRKKPRETSEDKQQSGDLFSKSDQIYFVSFVYFVSLSSLGFYKTQMLSSLNRLTS